MLGANAGSPAAFAPASRRMSSGSGSRSSDSGSEAEGANGLSVVRDPASSAAVVHEGFFCDGCTAPDAEPDSLRPIVGVRYSRRGDEYDLCSACYAGLSTREKRRYDALTEAVPPEEDDPDSETESDDDDADARRPQPVESSLDRRIASLEAVVDGSDDGDNDDDDGDDDGDGHGQGEGEDASVGSGSAAVPELERIQPLSQDSLPEFYRKSKVRKGNAAAAEAAVSAAAAAIVYEKAEKRSLYCRVCKQKFETVEALQSHRDTREHKAAEERDRTGSHCPLCDKQFTSPDQLREHVRGKWHQAREAAALKGGKFVAPGGKKKTRRGKGSNRKENSSRAPGGGSFGKKMTAALAPPEKKPLVVRFGTETGGQIKVKGRRKVLGGLREKPAAQKPATATAKAAATSPAEQQIGVIQGQQPQQDIASGEKKKKKKQKRAKERGGKESKEDRKKRHRPDAAN
jgi:hypothetical protein